MTFNKADEENINQFNLFMADVDKIKDRCIAHFKDLVSKIDNENGEKDNEQLMRLIEDIFLDYFNNLRVGFAACLLEVRDLDICLSYSKNENSDH